MIKTDYKSSPIPGKKLYQQRAAKALPILVRQAHAHCPISYSGLAAELQMPNPRNLNYVLGSVGATIAAVNKETGGKIPPVQALVINQGSRLPGRGFDNYDPDMRLDALPPRQRRLAIGDLFDDIYTYQKWDELLNSLGLEPMQAKHSRLPYVPTTRGGKGEGEDHRRLKHWIAKNPRAVGVRAKVLKTDVEHPIPSGDVLDVFFEERKTWTAIEVKASKSADGDLLRGIYQCVKYEAVLEALAITTNHNVAINVSLVLEGSLPIELRAISNQLGVSVIEKIHLQK